MSSISTILFSHCHCYKCTGGSLHTYCIARVMFIIEDTTVAMNCKTAIKALSRNLNVCPYVISDCPRIDLHPYSFLLIKYFVVNN